MMQLSPETISVLVNFAQINPNMILTPGNTLRTIHPSKALFATAEIAETIESDAAILDLSRFLRTIALLEEPNIEFGDKQFTISGSKSKTKIRYTYADPTSMLRVPKGVVDVKPDATLKITADTLKSIMVAGKSLKLPSIRFRGTDDSAYVDLYDPKGQNKDDYTIDVTDSIIAVEKDFDVTMNIEHINFVLRDYEVSVNPVAVKFDGGDVNYMVAADTIKK